MREVLGPFDDESSVQKAGAIKKHQEKLVEVKERFREPLVRLGNDISQDMVVQELEELLQHSTGLNVSWGLHQLLNHSALLDDVKGKMVRDKVRVIYNSWLQDEKSPTRKYVSAEKLAKAKDIVNFEDTATGSEKKNIFIASVSLPNREVSASS